MTGAAIAGVSVAAVGAIVGSAALADYVEEKSGLKEAYRKRMATEEYKNMSQDQAKLSAGVGASLQGKATGPVNPSDILKKYNLSPGDVKQRQGNQWTLKDGKILDIATGKISDALAQGTPVNPGTAITPAPTAESVFGPEGLQPLNQQQRTAAGVDESGNRVATTADDNKSKEQLDATRKQIALWEDIHSTLLDLVRYSRTTAEAVQ
jgi:hypothetical protein